VKKDTWEGKDSQGYKWIKDERNEEYYYLKDFPHLIVTKVNNYDEHLPSEHWEAIVFEDDSCQQIIGRQSFNTEREAKKCLEQIMEIVLKNRL